MDLDGCLDSRLTTVMVLTTSSPTTPDAAADPARNNQRGQISEVLNIPAMNTKIDGAANSLFGRPYQASLTQLMVTPPATTAITKNAICARPLKTPASARMTSG